MALDPIRTTQAVTESYLRYLSTTFRLRDAELRGQLGEALRYPGKFVKGPILEATPPFETGSTIESLIQEGVLSQGFRSLQSDELPLDRPLHRHQEEAIRKHLEGELTLGLDTSADSTTRWLCLDVDTKEERVMRSLWRRLDRAHIPHLTEFSGRKGYHLWVFFSSPVPNRMARALGRALTPEHEMFPRQDRIAAGGLGSLVKAPLGLHRVTGARCLFVDRHLNALPDQEQALAGVRTVDPRRTLARRFPNTWPQVGPKLQAPPAANSTFNAPSALAPLPLIKDCVRQVLLEGTGQGHRNQVGYIVATELRRVGMLCAQAAPQDSGAAILDVENRPACTTPRL